MGLKTCALLLFCCTLFAQPQPLPTDIRKLYAAFDDVDIDALSNMLCTNGDKASLYDKLDAYFLNDECKFRYVFSNVKYNFSPEKIIGGKSFYTVSFRNVIRITYFKPLSNILETQEALKQKFNAQSAVYDKTRNCFLIVYNARLVAFNDTENLQWKYFFADNTLPKSISESCCSDEIKKELALN